MSIASWRILLVCGCLLVGKVLAAEPAIAVIVAAGSTHRSYTSEEIANVFRRRLRFATDGTALVPVNLPLGDPVREAFSRSVFDLEPEDMEAYWNELYFHGISPPYVVASIEAMLRFVATTAGAVGYVLDCQVDDRVVSVMSLPVAEPDPRLRALCAQGAVAARLPELQTKLAHRASQKAVDRLRSPPVNAQTPDRRRPEFLGRRRSDRVTRWVTWRLYD
jgi:hypothetical protein